MRNVRNPVLDVCTFCQLTQISICVSFLYQVLIGITSAGKPLRGFNAKELLPAECLSSLVGLLSESSVKPSLHTKSMALLFNLGE